ANESHKGRGGWTWYTGSAGWMYQFIIGSLLGLELQKDRLTFNPCFPVHWPSVTITYKHGKSTYRITVFQSSTNEDSWWSDGSEKRNGNVIELVDDGNDHVVEVHVQS
ncbi:MAG: hypothetical protein ACXVBZ_12085, partial [Flavisolibacter sp.]